MKRLLVTLAVAGCARRARVGARPPARELHRQPPDGDRALGRSRLRPLRARPGGDPDLPARRRASAPSASPREAARGLELRLDGRRAPLRLLERRVSERPGAGGLKTLRFDAVYAAAGSGSRLAFRDRNFASRIGWREIVVRARGGSRAAVGERACREPQRRSARVPERSAPLAARRHLGHGLVHARRGRRHAAAAPRARRLPSTPKGGFESLVSRGDLSLGVILLSLLIAAFWGAAHALTPGHGKAIVAGYLVGTKGQAASTPSCSAAS